MNRTDDTKVSLSTAVETLGIILRYILWGAFVILYLTGHARGSLLDIIIITAVIGTHNAFAHAVLLSKRHTLFASRINFLVYFIETCLVVKFSGAESSDLFILYHLVLIGYGAYAPRLGRTVLVGLLFSFSYAVVIFVEYFEIGISEPTEVIAFRLASIIICGFLVGILNDALKRTRDKLQAQAQAFASSEATLRAILNSAADPLVVYDERELIVEANEPASDLFGVPRERLMGQRIRAFLFDDGTLPQKIAALRARGASRTEEIVLNADGSERSVQVTVRSFIHDQERFFVALFHDITENKNLQEATRLANLELERVNRELQQVNRVKADFWATISQKLRSPLSAILGHLDMLLEEELGELAAPQRKALHACRRAALRCLQLTDAALVAPPPPPPDAPRDKVDPRESGRP